MVPGIAFRIPSLALVMASALVVGCSDSAPPVSPRAIALEHAAHASVAGNPSAYQKELAALRQATAPFHEFGTAMQAGWSNQFTPCIANPAGPGAMGFHYVNNALVDGQLDVAAPEALIYEPTDNGRMRLVAVEYIVPFSVVPANGTPPTLYGLNFAPSARFQVWGLHAWVWKHNTNGMHAPFNPDVSCP